ncbi:MAG TPA: choice-of-anchor D domain-containing protein, partial [Kofleriaceae bacterium]
VRYNNAVTPHTATVSLVISNSGDAGTTLNVSNVSVSNTQDFSVSGTLPAVLGTGASATFVITFDPLAAGASSATLQIDSDDPLTAQKNISLSGVGSTAVIGVTDIAFSTVAVGTSPSQNITVSNTGLGTRGLLTVTQARFLNDAPGWFKFNAPGCAGTTTPCPLTMSMTTGTATLPILCNPPTTALVGDSSSAMVIFTSDSDDATDTVAMLSCNAGRADISVVQTPLAFGDQLINTTSTAKTVQISNSGNLPLTYSVALTDATHFVLTGAAGCTTNCSVPAMSSVTVSVAFRPTTVGAKTASLNVTASNDPDAPPPFAVPLSGNGVAPVSTPSALTLGFGSVDVGDTSTTQMLTVTNNGTYPLTISSAYMFAGAADYVISAGTTGNPLTTAITLQPTQTTSWTIACKPTVMGSRPGTFRITSNHNGTAGTNQDIGLTCNGLQGVLAFIAPPSNPYDFGGVRENDTRMQTFTLRNNGNTPVTNINVAFSGTGTGYTFAPTSIASIAAGAQTTITVTFAPLDGTYGGVYTGTYTGSWGTGKSTSAAQTVTGDGLTTGYDTLPSYPNALDFGDVRFDQTKTMNVSVINTAGTTLQIRGFTITLGTAQTGEFAVTRCLKNNVQITCPTTTAPYTSSGINDTIVLEVTVNPANRVAMLDATLTVTSDLPTNPSRMVPLKANSITAAIALNPSSMVLDFGPTDIDAVPVAVTRTVTLTNTGAAPLDFSSVTKIGGPLGNVRFTFSATTAPATVQPGGNYDIQVTYTPVLEKPSNQPDTGSITFGGVAGVFGSAMTVTIQLSGYGVDRHISIAPAPTFPDTYKNPGADAPVRPVTITNNGDAPLNVSAVMVTNEPIWTLVNPEPVTVPGRGTYAFNVKFAPQMAGKAPVGHMTIMNNDNGLPLAAVDLNGNGLDRQIAVGPPTIDLGYVGIGMTVKLSEITSTQLLSVENADSKDWQIAKIEIMDGDGAFKVQTLAGTDVPADLNVAARGTQQFDVLFTPSYEGDFTASAVVFIGADPQQPVTLKGRGLYVDTGGGGGCSTGRSNGIAMVLVMLALVLGRKRRGLLAAFAMVTGITAAHAEDQENRNVSLSLFDPTPAADVGATFQLQGADVAEAGSYGVLTLASYANQPLLLHTSQNDDAAIEHRTTFELGGVYSFGAFELGARMPLFVQSGAALPTSEQRMQMFGIAPGSTARGDLTVHGKYQIGARGGVSYGLAAAVTAPTHSKDAFAGNELPTGRGLFLLSIVHGPLTTTLNAGGVVRGKAQLGSATQGSGALFGAGLALRVLDKMWIAGEIFGEVIPGGQSGQPSAGQPMGADQLGLPIEWLAGLRYQMARTTNLGLAVGRGVTGDMGSPALRGVLTLAFTPSAVELKPLHPPRPPEPEKDADGDGLQDKLDRCPNEPEDKDLYDDADGCPDLDNDGDGIADVADKCPLDAEDQDRFQDDDGCPDDDNDVDRVADVDDRCPMV